MQWASLASLFVSVASHSLKRELRQKPFVRPVAR